MYKYIFSIYNYLPAELKLLSTADMPKEHYGHCTSASHNSYTLADFCYTGDLTMGLMIYTGHRRFSTDLVQGSREAGVHPSEGWTPGVFLV